MKKQPVNNVVWVDRDKLTANDYNPNHVYKPEMELLKRSIIKDGWTQPLVINEENEIIDGYHRWTVAADEEIWKMTDGKVPCVKLLPSDRNAQKISTVRHNRARGTHNVVDMATIVQDMLESNMEAKDIISELGMTKEELVRFANRKGIPLSDKIKDLEFSNAWVPDFGDED